MKRIHHSKKKKVEDTFFYVRKTFFPHWDKNKKWGVLAANFPAPGRTYCICDHKNKTIWFRKIPRNKTEFLVLMLDEISHARVPGLKPKGHGREWVKNMRQAEEIAKKKEFTDLAKEINFHIKINKFFKKHDKEQVKRYWEKKSVASCFLRPSGTPG